MPGNSFGSYCFRQTQDIFCPMLEILFGQTVLFLHELLLKERILINCTKKEQNAEMLLFLLPIHLKIRPQKYVHFHRLNHQEFPY